MAKTRTFALVFATIGIAVPICVLALRSVSAEGFSSAWIFVVWPSYFILGGLSGTVDAVVVAHVVISILINAILYAYVGSVIARLIGARAKPKAEAKQ